MTELGMLWNLKSKKDYPIAGLGDTDFLKANGTHPRVEGVQPEPSSWEPARGLFFSSGTPPHRPPLVGDFIVSLWRGCAGQQLFPSQHLILAARGWTPPGLVKKRTGPGAGRVG